MPTYREAMTQPRPSETRHATADDGTRLAYRVVGEGPPDVLWSFSQLSDVETIWEHRPIADFLLGLAASARVIVHDRRGMGRSSGSRGDLDTDVADLLRLLDAVGADRPFLFGAVIGGAIYAAFAARYPDRVAGLAWHGAFARSVAGPDYPWAPTPDEAASYARQLAEGWGSEPFAAAFVAGGAPSRAGDAETIAFFARWMRRTSDVATADAYNRAWDLADLHELLPGVRVPTLITVRGDGPGEARHVAALVPGARVAVFEGDDFMPFYDAGPIIAALRAFMADPGAVPPPPG
ncbi:MAG: alpha/beta hydrolase [Chloroflexi bacterium]|nr:alpha/beta hydrolase [Chloroflexota bacterium]